jgi:hypothetical protein
MNEKRQQSLKSEGVNEVFRNNNFPRWTDMDRSRQSDRVHLQPPHGGTGLSSSFLLDWMSGVDGFEIPAMIPQSKLDPETLSDARTTILGPV